MRAVAIVGIGQTPRTQRYFRDTDTYSWKDYIVEATFKAIANCDKGLEPKDIDYIVANYHGEGQIQHGGLGPVVAETLGILPTGCTVLSANCAGGGVGLNEAYGLIASGRYNRVLCIGFEKAYDLFNDADKRAIGGDVEFDYELGYDHPTLQALLQLNAYRDWGFKRTLKCLIQNRVQGLWFAKRTPEANFYDTEFTIDKDEMFKMIDEMDEDSHFISNDFYDKLPVTRVCEGCAALILVPADEALSYSSHPIFLDAVGYKANSHLLSNQMHDPNPLLSAYTCNDFAAVQLAADEAYKFAGRKPSELNFCNVYEPHITSFIPMLTATQVTKSCSDMLDFVLDGQTAYDGRLPCGTDGGRGMFGMTSGSNVGDCVVECVRQMRGLCGERQLKKVDISMAMGMQGEMGSSACCLLRNSR